jgi:hypothetical protein
MVKNYLLLKTARYIENRKAMKEKYRKGKWGIGICCCAKAHSFTLFYISVVDYQIGWFILTHLQN